MTDPAEADPAYRRALARLAERGRFGIRLGLGRTRALLRRLGDPQRDLPGVLIAGTNGKGSVQAMVAAALCAAGYRTGQTPKPHLVSYRERLVVDGEQIAAAEFAALIDQVLAEAVHVEKRHGPPTEFELLTAAAFSWFRSKSVELAVVEVGLGGRLDATNTWQGGLSAITNIGLDHTEHLGQTIEAIATEKAQIIKRGDLRALTGASGAALRVIERRARRVGVPLRQVEPLAVIGLDRSGTLLDLPSGELLRLGLLGRHQAQNAALALAIIQALNETSLAAVPASSVRQGLATVRWPGRLELLALGEGHARHDVLLDGAHNPDGSEALARALEELRPHLSAGRATLLMGVLRDKDLPGMLEPLQRCSALADAQLIATDVPGTRRSLAAADLAAAWNAGDTARGLSPPAARVIPDATDALDSALEAARMARGTLLVCGSLYLVGYVRGRLVESRAI